MALPVSGKLEDKLQCSICLELFREPVTLPCGHNFCKCCISDHWRKQEQVPAGAKKGYTCPVCRRDFGQRPELEKNITLCTVVEMERAGEEGALGTEKGEVAHAELCPQHGRPLELYCRDEQRCICCVCIVQQCQGHRRVLCEEEHSEKQDASERLRSVVLSKFAVLKKALEDHQWQTSARIEQEETAALGCVEENWNLLKDRLDVLGQHRERAQRLLACPDQRTFLQAFPHLPPLESSEALPPVRFDVDSIVEPINETLTNISRLLLVDLPGSVASRAADLAGQDLVHLKRTAVKEEASVPKFQLRDELLKDHRNLTFDPETANKYLELSKGNRKAKHSPGAVCRRQEQGPRFEPWQVLCTQGYSHGHHYWEVKISSHAIVLGVTYPGLPWQRQQGHKFNIGLDGGSWGLQVWDNCYLAWHKGQAEKIQERLYKNLGVSLDYNNGCLSFYGLGEGAHLIYSFHSIFTKPLYPVFWLCEGREVTLCCRD
ncbi:E3 ubiquitin-protein ligase TRIM65 isoform X2 [Pogoniulus pusillus]|uniref:E3 ubiquitin-protein ligase TRIM65 isoform X2 n=1 Tax=Pogoniulus pusillus TaxID=488313 RepID=UPI0030B9681E